MPKPIYQSGIKCPINPITNAIAHNIFTPIQDSPRYYENLSRSLSHLLRHEVEGRSLQFHDGVYVVIEDILQDPYISHRKYTEEDVIHCVEINEKKRFGLKRDTVTGKNMICAFQGHSIKMDGDTTNTTLKEINNAKDYPFVIHGTYKSNYKNILKSGLSRMARQHIHFAQGVNVISGARKNCDIFIVIDMEQAIKDGYKFFVSENGVILSEGNIDGIIPPKYFKRTIENLKN